MPEGTREDAQRAIAAANGAWRDWSRRSAFERAAAMERVADLIVERRDELALTLTLDQGKPLHSEAYGEVDELVEYWRMAAADAKRLDGSMPPSVDASKRILGYRVPRGVVGVITPWNWPYTMPAELLAPALAAGNAVVWAPASSTSVCAVKLAECIVDAELPAGVFSMVTGRGAVVGDEIAGNPGTHAIGFIGSVDTGLKVATRAAGKALLLELGGNGPMIVLEDADVAAAAEASLVASFLCAGQSCTAGERFLVHEAVHDEFVERLRRRSSARSGSATRCCRRRRWGRSTTSRRRRRWTSTSPTRSTAAPSSSPAARAPRASRPGSTGRRRCSTASPRRWRSRARRRSGRSSRSRRSRATTRRCRSRTRLPYGLLTAVWTRDLARGLRFAEAVDAGWVNINESTNYWESHLPVRRPLGQELGRRPRRRPPGDGDVHRAEDGGGDALERGGNPGRNLVQSGTTMRERTI